MFDYSKLNVNERRYIRSILINAGIDFERQIDQKKRMLSKITKEHLEALIEAKKDSTHYSAIMMVKKVRRLCDGRNVE